MAIRTILRDGNETLLKTSRPVEKFDDRLWQLLDDMKDTMEKHDGVGLAAPQIGVLRRICVIDIGEGLIELINPQIIEQSGVQNEVEGCLSCPGKYGTTTRPMKVKVKALDRRGREYTVEGIELMARALCHEIDHLDGKMFTDNATDIFVD